MPRHTTGAAVGGTRPTCGLPMHSLWHACTRRPAAPLSPLLFSWVAGMRPSAASWRGGTAPSSSRSCPDMQARTSDTARNVAAAVCHCRRLLLAMRGLGRAALDFVEVPACPQLVQPARRCVTQRSVSAPSPCIPTCTFCCSQVGALGSWRQSALAECGCRCRPRATPCFGARKAAAA